MNLHYWLVLLVLVLPPLLAGVGVVLVVGAMMVVRGWWRQTGVLAWSLLAPVSRQQVSELRSTDQQGS